MALNEIGPSSRERLTTLAKSIGREEFAMNVLEIPDEKVLDMLADELAKLYDMRSVNEAFDELDDGFDQEMEDLIKAGPRLNKDRFEDVIYYIHNNWMAGNYGDDYAIRRISNYLNAR